MRLFRHVLIYFFEIILATTFIVWVINGGMNFNVGILEILRQYVFAYTLYQLILLAVFKIKDSLEADALASMKNEVDRFQIYAEFKIPIPTEKLEEVRDKLVKNKEVVLDKKHRVFFDNLIKYTNSYINNEITNESFRCTLKQDSRELEFNTKIVNYYWMNSILLRLLKNNSR